MNTRLMAWTMAAGLAAGAAGAAPKPFEGSISMTMDHAGTSTPSVWRMKGAKTRMEMSGGPHGGMTMILDAGRKIMIMLMTEQKMYMEMPLQAPRGAAAAGTKGAKVVKTGKQQKILGYLCDEYRAEGDHGTAEIWAAKGLGTFAPMGGGQPGAPRAAWEDEMIRGGYFPLRMVNHDASGAETMKMTVTAIEPGTLADALFAPPADYQKFSMPAGAMGGGPPH